MISDYRLYAKLTELKPLTDQQLRDLWVGAPYPETKKLLWEIRRLQRIIEGLHRSAVSLTAGYTGAASSFATSAQTLLSEPCVQAYISKSSGRPFDAATWLEEEICDLRATASARYLAPKDHPSSKE